MRLFANLRLRRVQMDPSVKHRVMKEGIKPLNKEVIEGEKKYATICRHPVASMTSSFDYTNNHQKTVLVEH
jgi:hypothetical protein